MENYFRVGVLTGTHGLKGEIKIFSTTDSIDRFKSLKRAFLDLTSSSENSEQKPIDEKKLLEVEVESVKFFKKSPILKFKGIDSIDDIVKYKGLDLLVKREDAVPLKEGEYYIADVIGCKVISDTGEEYGEVSEVFGTGANKVITVKANDSHKELKEFYLPYIPDCVLEINVIERFVKVHIMKGLLD